MGTSSIYSGPGGKSKLLPDWIDQNSLTDDQKENISAEWTATKTALTRMLNKKSQRNATILLSHYVKAYGGSRNFVNSSSSFTSRFDNIWSFLRDIGTIGISTTTKNYEIDFSGKNIQEILVIFSNQFFPSGSDKEAAATRTAMSTVFELILDEIKLHPDLDILSDDVLNIIMKSFVTEYILIRLLSDIGSSYEKSIATPNEIKQMEDQIKEYLHNCVENQLGNIDFIHGREPINIDDLLMSCIKKIGGE